MFKHPKGLYILFFTELWERFSFYGMKALLIYYLTKYHFFSDTSGAELVGNYAALVFAFPILGGFFADKYLGFKKAVIFGGILLIAGHFGMAFEGHQASIVNGEIVRDTKALNIFYLSMSLIIIGVGFLKPNISTMVGQLYPDGDRRKDGGFTIFYMGINIGAAGSTILCGWLGETFGWKYGFGAAGVGMILGLVILIIGKKALAGIGEPPNQKMLKKRRPWLLNTEYTIYAFAISLVFAVWFLVRYHTIVGVLLIGACSGVLAYLTWYMIKKCDKVQRDRLIVLIILFVYAVIYFAFLEQQFISLNLFTDRMVDREVLGHEIKASNFLSLNSIYIVIFAPILAALWIKLGKINKEPNILMKFGLGVLQAGLAFGLLLIGIKIAGIEQKVAVIWLILFYLLVTLGELFVSPVGLSSVTKLSPKKIVGFLMGSWFLASAVSEYLAAVFSKIASVETDKGEIVNYKEAFSAYSNLFFIMLLFGIISGVVLIIASPFLKKMMHGIK